MNLKKIALIYPFAYGYIDFVIKEISSHKNIEVTDIKTDSIVYSYPNIFVKIINGISKIFGRNIKKQYFNKEILSKIISKQDIIFIIRPDLLDDTLLKELKSRSQKIIAYYYDSCTKYPRQVEVKRYFDEVYSYEKEDILKYQFLETSNFIYDTSIQKEEIKYDIFNISSYDSRINEIDALSRKLAEGNMKIHFLLFWYKKLSYPNLISITEYIPLEETKKMIAQSKAMIDIQREDQKGLSFRTFESLGYRKKLLTTNKTVINYDFFHPNNILVIDPENISIEQIKLFLDLPYVEISHSILNKYSVQNFVKNIFKL